MGAELGQGQLELEQDFYEKDLLSLLTAQKKTSNPFNIHQLHMVNFMLAIHLLGLDGGGGLAVIIRLISLFNSTDTEVANLK